MINFFQKYLQINTAQPNPQYDQVLALFEQQAKKDGFAYQIIKLPSGYKAFIATLPGTNPELPSIVLNHHIDVVPASDEEKWLFPPFAGQVVNGMVYGRGTQDMKGIGFVHYAAMKRLKDAGIALQRTVHWVGVPDEEVGGYKGAGQLVETPEFKKLNVGFVLDEGLSSGDNKKLFIKVSERKPMQMKFVSRGDMVHGSRINCVNASHELTMFLAQIARFQQEQKTKLGSQPAGLMLSINVTSLSAGVNLGGKVALNVVPEEAIATIDMRVPPTMEMAEAQKKIDSMIKDFPTITYTVEAKGTEALDQENNNVDFFQSLQKAVEQQGLKAEKFYAEESSDMRFYLAKGIHGFGLTPFTTKENIHRVNECISVQDVELGTNLFFDFLRDFGNRS